MNQTIQNTQHRLDWIEATRGIAAVTVVLYHVARHVEKTRAVSFWSALLQFGHAGVDLFFVISGFVILHVHYKDLGQPDRFAHYLNRRLTRIYPPYWVALALTIIFGAFGSSGVPEVLNILFSATLLPSHQDPLLGVAWTLQHEIVFYAIFAVLIFHQGLGLAVLGVWLIGVSAHLLFKVPSFGLPASVWSAYNFEFVMGLAVAYGLRHWRMPSAKTLISVGGGFLAFWAFLENLHFVNGYGQWMRLAYGAASALLVAGCASAGKCHVALPAWLRALGSASYSIYLFQFVFIGVLWKVSSAFDWQGVWVPHVEFFVLSLGAVLGGIWVSRFVEYPLMGWIRRRIARLT